MNEVFRKIKAATIAGESVDLVGVGGEDAIYDDAEDLARSAVFGDIAEILVRDWPHLRKPETAESFVATGLREQPDRIVLGHAIDVIAQAPWGSLRAIVLALDEHARNRNAAEFVRTEAAAGVLRLALRERQWKAMASSLLIVLEELQDQSA